MSEKPLKVEKKKTTTKRTVTLYTNEGHFECPVVDRITGRVHDRVVPILEDYEKALGEPVPEVIKKMQEITDEKEREEYANRHAIEIGAYLQQATGFLTRLKTGDRSLTPRQLKVTRSYVLRTLRAILDTEKLEDEQQRELIATEIDSEFWLNQDLEEARDHVERFRRRLA